MLVVFVKPGMVVCSSGVGSRKIEQGFNASKFRLALALRISDKPQKLQVLTVTMSLLQSFLLS